MRIFNEDVFDEFVTGTTEVFTPCRLDAVLGAAEKLMVHVRGTLVAGTSPTLTLKEYQSPDGRVWYTKDTLLTAQAMSVGSVYETVVYDPNNHPSMAYVRLGITLGGTMPGANIQVMVCGRAQHPLA